MLNFLPSKIKLEVTHTNTTPFKKAQNTVFTSASTHFITTTFITELRFASNKTGFSAIEVQVKALHTVSLQRINWIN